MFFASLAMDVLRERCSHNEDFLFPLLARGQMLSPAVPTSLLPPSLRYKTLQLVYISILILNFFYSYFITACRLSYYGLNHDNVYIQMYR
jgi:hypothetical protein